MKSNRLLLLLLLGVAALLPSLPASQHASAQIPIPAGPLPVLETGGQTMPDAWIDRETGHRVIRLTRREGHNGSFYFHNNPFVRTEDGRWEMLYAGGNVRRMGNDNLNERIRDVRQMFAVDLASLDIRQVTQGPANVSTEIVCAATRELFYQRGDTVHAVRTETGEDRVVAVMPPGKQGHIVTVNADGTLLAGTFNDPKEREIYRNNPRKGDYFNLIFEARLEKTIFVLDVRTGSVEGIYSEHAWLNHLQFSPTDPTLLMFCHEGPWHKVDRIWTIDVVKRGEPRLIHRRTMDMEIWGHEWWGADGRHIYFDLQKPRGQRFYVGKVDVYTGEEEDFELTRNEWSVHFTSSWDETFLAGDGGARRSVANAPDGKWIYRFDYDGDHLRSERLVNMIHHDYNLEPNIHFSPDDRWIIFRANFEGYENVYAVEVAPSGVRPEPNRQAFDAIVRPGESIQAAIEQAPDTPATAWKILIEKGTYREKVIIDRPNIILVGEDRDSTILIHAETSKTQTIREYHGKPVGMGVIVLQEGADDCVISGLTVYNNYGSTVEPTTAHQMAVYGRATRTIVINSNIWADGNDALSLWARGGDGMYYHADLYLRCPGVDFLCPRGWCYATRCRLYGDGRALIWHDGRGDASKRLVITHSTFDALSPTPLGRYHHDSQFFLVDCALTSRINDANISYAYTDKVLDPCPWGQRTYFARCTREGGHSGWLDDNLHKADPAVNPSPTGAPLTPEDLTPQWTFNGQWDPEARIRDLWNVLAY